jgi:hypothetical protein
MDEADGSAPSIEGSTILQALHDGAPPGQFTLQWVMASLHEQSYPAVIFLLAVVAVIPGISIAAGLLLLVPILQMLAGRPTPAFPRWIATRPLPTAKLTASLKRAIPVLKAVETTIHPRWPTALSAGSWMFGVVILLLTIRLLVWPLPLGNILPAALISLIALSYMEHDGLMLALSLAAGLIVLALDAKLLHDVVQEVITRTEVGGMAPPIMRYLAQAAAAS